MAVEVVSREYYLPPGPVDNGRYHIYQPIPLELEENRQNGDHSLTLRFTYKPVRLRSRKKVTYRHEVKVSDLASAEKEIGREMASHYRWAKYNVTLPHSKDNPLINKVLETLTPFFESPTERIV